MFVFGHIGIGRKLASPWSSRLPVVPLVAGMLLPDAIDKPLYYAQVWDYVSCTRTFGHTGVLALSIVAIAYARRSRAWAALGLGVATHLLLDCVSDFAGSVDPLGDRSSWRALIWPFGGSFVRADFMSMPAHLGRLWVTPVITCEIIGLALLAWDYWRARPAREIR